MKLTFHAKTAKAAFYFEITFVVENLVKIQANLYLPVKLFLQAIKSNLKQCNN